MYAYGIHRQGDKKAIAEAAKAVKASAAGLVSCTTCGARINTELGQYSGAIADLKKAVQLSPNYGQAALELAKLLAACPRDSLRELEAGRGACSRASQLHQRRQDAWSSLAVLGMAMAEAGRV